MTHAIIGCGRVAPNHVDGFGAVPAVQIRWACDRDGPTADTFGRTYSVARITTDVDEVLADPDVDSVSVLVDHAQHTDIAKAALHAGKHVLVEKPVALNSRAAWDLIALAEQKNLVFSVVSQHRYDPLVRRVRQWVEDGLLGRLVLCNVTLHSRRNEDYYADSYWRGTWSGEGGSALINQGYHCIDVAQSLCGPFTVQGATWSSSRLTDVIETDETLAAVLTAPNGLAATLAVTVSSSEVWRSRICLAGEAGTVEFDLDHPNRLHRCTGNPILEQEGASFAVAVQETAAPAGLDYYGISHRRQAADFCRSVRTGEPMLYPASDAVGTLALIQDVYRASGRLHGS
ncbi:Gfo/Idh/MocA family oxidoreductase [Streptomyces sp900105245]|uniref:Gfo/Idh/MocA family oxidoreductase n=1 Tax=Streptomyces sp. 900105245 TaxID=3154379 RepID=A0ABV1UJ96_9ACTN